LHHSSLSGGGSESSTLRDDYIAAYGPGGVVLTTFTVSDLHTAAWGDTVLLSGVVELQGAHGDQRFEHRSRFLDVYRQRNRAWQLVASSVTDIVR
jgi:ketosteroid isomerase-like protein